MGKVKKYTSGELVERLRTKYKDAQRYAFFEQVANSTGYSCRSWIDAAVVRLWPSDGLTRDAFEVKVSRADFLNELKNAEKNAWAKEYFHQFWFVAPSNVIKEEELPEGTGWLCPHGDKLIVKRHASRKKDAKMDDAFFASLVRSTGKASKVDKAVMEQRVLDDSRIHQMALAYERAARKFLKKHGKVVYGRSPKDVEEDVYVGLKSTTIDDRTQKERDHIQRVLTSFQDKIVEMYDAMTAIAFTGILEVDEANDFITGIYGASQDAVTLAQKRAVLASKKKKDKDNFGHRGWGEMLQTFDFMRDRIAQMDMAEKGTKKSQEE